jgi:uncharacterized protein YjbI with pentapeptide repeats
LVTAGTKTRARHPHGASDPANLGRANLKGTWLAGANLREANLHGADLTKATLHEADLTGAKADGDTIWPDGFDPVAAGVIFY